MIRVRATTNQNIDNIVVSLAHCVKKRQLLQSVFLQRTNTLVKEKLDKTSGFSLVFESTCLKKCCLLVVELVISKILKVKSTIANHFDNFVNISLLEFLVKLSRNQAGS
jgi:hypothetical protein